MKKNVLFAKKKSRFEEIYCNQKIPCYINHGSINNWLEWEKGVNLENV